MIAPYYEDNARFFLSYFKNYFIKITYFITVISFDIVVNSPVAAFRADNL